MPKSKDLVGCRFGALRVVERHERNRFGQLTWRCICDCGEVSHPVTAKLIGGATRSCGCGIQKTSNAEDLTGRIFGRLTALKRVGSLYGSPAWECECSCRQRATVPARALRAGNTKSCGCLRKSKFSAKAGDLIGELTLIAQLPGLSGSRNGTRWQCLCSCGRQIVKHSWQLRDHKYSNCRSLVHRHTYRVYPPTPTCYPAEAATIAAKYYYLASRLNQGLAEDIAIDLILRGAWICHWRQIQGFPVERELQYFLKLIRVASLIEKTRQYCEKNANRCKLQKRRKIKQIGSEMTDSTFLINPEPDSGENVVNRSKRKLSFQRK